MTRPILTNEQQRALHTRLREDLPFYAKKVLKITDKSGKLVPFVFNRAQNYIHEQLEKQKRETGKVRAYILKGRQQGCSTYVGARFYKSASWDPFRYVYILSHEATSTATLFEKVQMYYDESPEPLRPQATVSNKKELKFANGSRYRVGTAGARATGRSQTNQLFHGSEVAYYENTDDIQSGVLQTVANAPDTEIILESTANGIGNAFYQGCMDALAGRGEYILIFVPWFWQPEYAMEPPPNWDFTPEELDIQARFDLTDAQLYWRYNKIIELKSESVFKQEYPCTVQEAFQASGASLINADMVQDARKSTLKDPNAPLVLGVDPARKGDRTVLAYRRGREVFEVRKYDEMNEMRLAGIIANEIDRRAVDKCFIDVGLGYGTIDRLHELGYKGVVQGVNFSQKPLETQYLNKRAEMAMNLRDWLHEGGVSVPDDEEVEADLLAIPDFKENSRGLIYIESKDKIKEAFGKSTDIFDAMMLTFAFPVRAANVGSRFSKRTESSKQGSPLSTMARRRQRQNQETKHNESIWGVPKKRI